MITRAELVQILATIRTSLAALFSRGVALRVDDEPSVQRMQVRLGEGEEFDGIEHVESYGFTSRAPGTPELVTLSRAGERGHTIVIAAHARGTRPTGQEAGEVAIYDDLGKRILLKRDGTIEIAGASEITIHGNAQVNGDVTATGEVADAVGTLDELRQTYNAHTHGGVRVGSGSTAPPTPQA